MSRLALVVGLALATSACGPYLTAQSLPPPGRVGTLAAVTGFWSVNHYKLAVSTGTAIAVSCTDGGPCEAVRAVSRDPAIAAVVPAVLARLEPAGMMDAQPAASFVVIGKQPGATRIDIRTKDGARWIEVVVEPAPAPAAAMAIP